MSEYSELQSEFCPACGERVRDAWTVPVAASPKTEFVATLADGHVELTDAGLRVYQHAGGDE